MMRKVGWSVGSGRARRVAATVGILAVAGEVGVDEGSAVGDGYLDDGDLLDVSALGQPAAVRGAQVERPVAFSVDRDEVALAVVIEDDDGQRVPATAATAGYRQLPHQRWPEQRCQAVADVSLHPRWLEVSTTVHA